MRIFITGASGYIGNAVAKAFRTKGHQVYGLVRKEEDARSLRMGEISPVIGDLDQPESYREALEEAEVAVHCAFDSSSSKGVERDAKTVDFILKVFSKSPLPRSFIYTSGVWVYGSLGSKLVDESTPLKALEIVKWRPSHEEKVVKACSPYFRTVVLRPGIVFGLNGGLLQLLFNSIEKGELLIPRNGENRWPMVHVEDLAYAYVSAAEKELSGVTLNVVDDSTSTLREIGNAIANAAGLEGKIRFLSNEEAQKHFGPVAEGLLADLTVNNSRIKRLLGWQMHHAPFIYEADLYYQAWKSSRGK